MWRYALPLALFVLLGIALAIGLNRDPSLVPSPLIGRPAPAFSLPSLQDASYAIATQDLHGQPWLLNVWATWCVGCRQEHEVLLQIAAEDAVLLIGLNWKDDNAAARQWLAELGNPYAAVAEDREGRVAIDWGVYAAPETFLIGPDGTVLHKHIAPMTLEIWRSEFLPRIASARQGTGGGRS
jgi:cytochrome c biogenesis protein CcmG, thiol:disulfide interchange protein DsbE